MHRATGSDGSPDVRTSRREGSPYHAGMRSNSRTVCERISQREHERKSRRVSLLNRLPLELSAAKLSLEVDQPRLELKMEAAADPKEHEVCCLATIFARRHLERHTPRLVGLGADQFSEGQLTAIAKADAGARIGFDGEIHAQRRHDSEDDRERNTNVPSLEARDACLRYPRTQCHRALRPTDGDSSSPSVDAKTLSVPASGDRSEVGWSDSGAWHPRIVGPPRLPRPYLPTTAADSDLNVIKRQHPISAAAMLT